MPCSAYAGSNIIHLSGFPPHRVAHRVGVVGHDHLRHYGTGVTDFLGWKSWLMV